MIAILLTLAAAAQNYDAVAAAPTSHRVLLEDDKVRVLRVEIPPGATEPMHEHRWPSVMYFEQPQPITYVSYRLDGDRPVVVERVEAPALPKGVTVRAEPEGLHAITNRGTSPFLAIRVEFKDGRPPR